MLPIVKIIDNGEHVVYLRNLSYSSQNKGFFLIIMLFR